MNSRKCTSFVEPACTMIYWADSDLKLLVHAEQNKRSMILKGTRASPYKNSSMRSSWSSRQQQHTLAGSQTSRHNQSYRRHSEQIEGNQEKKLRIRFTLKGHPAGKATFESRGMCTKILAYSHRFVTTKSNQVHL